MNARSLIYSKYILNIGDRNIIWSLRPTSNGLQSSVCVFRGLENGSYSGSGCAWAWKERICSGKEELSARVGYVVDDLSADVTWVKEQIVSVLLPSFFCRKKLLSE